MHALEESTVTSCIVGEIEYLFMKITLWIIGTLAFLYDARSDCLLILDNLCRDQYFCKEMSKSAISCSKFPTIRESCPQSCGLCSCEDTRNCEGINPWICKVFPPFKSICPKTCGLCTKPLGKIRHKLE